MINNKKIIGIIGGIGSGKSQTAGQFAKLGCAVIDADQIGRDLLQTDKNLIDQLKNAFGDEIFTPENTPDRAKIAEIAFSTPGNTEKINQIMHPAILKECTRQIDDLTENPQTKAIVLDLPLLIEVNWEKKCDILIFVDTNEQIRRKRSAQKGRSCENNLKKRENLQISLDKKKNIAHYIVNNNSDFSAIAEQVAKIFSNLDLGK